MGIVFIGTDILVAHIKPSNTKLKPTHEITMISVAMTIGIIVDTTKEASIFSGNGLLSLLVLLMWCLPKIDIDNVISINIQSIVSIFMLIIASTIVQDVTYGQNFNTVITNPMARLVLTISIYFIIISIFFIIFGNIKLASISYSLVYTALLLINLSVLQGRGVSLQFNDLLAGDILDVAFRYKLDLTYNIYTGLLILLITSMFIVNVLTGNVRFSTKSTDRISPIIVLCIGIAMITPFSSQKALENYGIYSRPYEENNYGIAVNLYSGAISDSTAAAKEHENSCKLIDEFSKTGNTGNNYNLEVEYNKLKDKTTVDLIGGMVYQTIAEENKDLYLNIS